MVNWLDHIAVRLWPDLAIVDGRLPYFAVPNGGNRNAITGAIMKREGVRAGVPDLLIMVPSSRSHGLAIEMKKVKGSTTSKEQKAWGVALRKMGYHWEVCKGHEQAIDSITKYLQGGM